MASLTLEQFRDLKLRGFPGWETAVTPDYEGATAYVDPVDARYETPSSPLGKAPGATGIFERWCAENLTGDYFVVAGTSGSLVYCQLKEDAVLVRRSFGVSSAFLGTPD